jgi:NhaA family Na+:H+ antiporter
LRVARVAGRPLERFLQIEAASGILLLLAAAIALTLANSRWAAEYAHFWHTPVGIRVGAFAFERTLEWYVNDGLMVIFFFVVGMEIRREIHHGELSEWRRASLPIAAAAGGMVAPAALYLLLDREPRAHAGWGVPMATDIAFAVGILALLGKRVPPALRVLLLALAVIDDLGAIFVIAVFYTQGLDPSGFVVAACGFAGIFAMQRLGVRLKLAYVFPSVVAWAGVYAAGVHPTIAGVIVGLVTPVRAWLGPQGFIAGIREDLDRLSASMQHRASPHELAATLRHVDLARREAMSPAESLIESLHPWVAYGIMPVFALANAGVTLSGGALDSLALGVSVAVAAGLAVGKPVGILLAMGILIRLRWGQLPLGITLRHTLVLGCVAGVGFTMSLFIAQLAFTDDHLLAGAKIGVLSGSLVAGVFALVLGKLLLRPDMVAGAATTADEAESSTEA